MGYTNFTDLLGAAREAGSLGEAVIAREIDETGETRDAVVGRFLGSLDVMEASVQAGLRGDARSVRA